VSRPARRKPSRLRLHWPTVVIVVAGVAAIVACAAYEVPTDVIAMLASLVATAAGFSPPAASRPSGESSDTAGDD